MFLGSPLLSYTASSFVFPPFQCSLQWRMCLHIHSYHGSCAEACQTHFWTTHGLILRLTPFGKVTSNRVGKTGLFWMIVRWTGFSLIICLALWKETFYFSTKSKIFCSVCCILWNQLRVLLDSGDIMGMLLCSPFFHVLYLNIFCML